MPVLAIRPLRSVSSTFFWSLSSLPSADLLPSNDYTPCPNQKFCCASGDYCLYDQFLSARCYSDATYTFFYSYSWSYTFGLAYYTTYTEIDLSKATKDVVTLVTPSPPATIPSVAETVPAATAASGTTVSDQTVSLVTTSYSTTTIPMTVVSTSSNSATTIISTKTFESTSTSSILQLLGGVNATETSGLFRPFESTAPTESDPGDGFTTTASAAGSPTKSGAAVGSYGVSVGVGWLGALIGLVAFL